MINLSKVRPHIWHIKMDSRYELAMTFLRAQECYESPNDKFRNKQFTLIEYMEWYALEFNKDRSDLDDEFRSSFTYPVDWSGFNVPKHIFDFLYPIEISLNQIPDKNRYDARLYGLLQEIRMKEGEHEFYVIGTSIEAGERGVFGHEVAHGYYSTDTQYNKAINEVLYRRENTKEVHTYARGEFKKALRACGYCDEVLDDEIQAYAATGFTSRMEVLTEDEKVMEMVKEIGQVFAAWEKKHNG